MKKEILTLILFLAAVGFVFASGGKNRESNDIIGDRGCAVSIPGLECETVMIGDDPFYVCEPTGEVQILCPPESDED